VQACVRRVQALRRHRECLLRLLQLGGRASAHLRELALELLPALRRIPRRVDRITGALERGELTVRLRPFAHLSDASLVTRLANRFILAFISGSIGVVSVFLLQLSRGPTVLETHLDVLLGYGGLIAATMLGLRVLVAITRDGG